MFPKEKVFAVMIQQPVICAYCMLHVYNYDLSQYRVCVGGGGGVIYYFGEWPVLFLVKRELAIFVKR